jgi:hypothetical protein
MIFGFKIRTPSDRVDNPSDLIELGEKSYQYTLKLLADDLSINNNCRRFNDTILLVQRYKHFQCDVGTS